MSDQHGFALIALLSLAALIAAFLIASALNFTSADNSNEREDRSMRALRQAKAALIAYAANEQWQTYKSQATDQPGALPCPDIVHDGTEAEEGDSDCVAAGFSSTSNLIGRIPWKTLGIDDLRDASGERLWYALAHNFRKLSGTTVINSDTQACDTPACNPVNDIQLTVTGTAPASNVVAIIFAPGQALDLRQIGGPLQNRPADHTDPAYNNPINYLENFSLGDATGRHYSFITNAIPVDTFNDRLLVITQADLMAAVEPVVAARIERDVKPLLQAYFSKWGAYPFAVPFVAPPAGQSSYQGAPSQTRGLLPLTNTPNWFTWASATVTSIAGSGTGRYNGTPNTISPNPTNCTIGSSPLKATCTINYLDPSGGSNNDRPDVKLEIFLANASMAFADTPSMLAPDDLNIVMVDRNGVQLSNQGAAYGQWSKVGLFTPTLGFVARADGRGAVTYTGRLQNSGDTGGTVTITVPLPAPSYLPHLTNTSPTTPNITWFTSNQWYQQTYYAVSPGFAPGGGGSCNVVPAPPTAPITPSCLMVNNLPPSYATSNDKGAILVFSGRALDGSARPSSSLNNYLEGQNSTPGDFIYEHRAGVAGLSCAQFLTGTCPAPNAPYFINDRVVVVSP